MKKLSEQENFWMSKFGVEYITRNNSPTRKSAKLAMWYQMLRQTLPIKSAIEFGCNIGFNLEALSVIHPGIQLTGLEINKKAAAIASGLGVAEIIETSIVNDLDLEPAELSFTCGVCIHVAPELLPNVYKNLYDLSQKYILMAEYYSPTPVKIDYRGNKDKLFKRDFAGDFMGMFDVELVDYGFIYRRDPKFPQDDITWFLMKKV